MSPNLNPTDAKDRREAFKNDHQALNKYCGDVKGELNKTFTLVRYLYSMMKLAIGKLKDILS
jgi:hypothetical protein